MVRLLVLEDIPATQQERLAYLELMVRFLGECGRRELMDRFSIQEAAATRDFAAYRALAPNNLDFESSLKRYLPSASFKPLFEISPERALSWLSQGFGEGVSFRHKGHVLSEPVPFISKPDLDVVAILSRAIHQRKAVKIRYCSLSSGPSSREIVPFALANSGWRWHILLSARPILLNLREFKSSPKSCQFNSRIKNLRSLESGYANSRRSGNSWRASTGHPENCQA